MAVIGLIVVGGVWGRAKTCSGLRFEGVRGGRGMAREGWSGLPPGALGLGAIREGYSISGLMLVVVVEVLVEVAEGLRVGGKDGV